ncbi:alginate lyase family protein [Wenjunlia tyrosinilytica]|uniref:Alginate lyase domain-containing protein n=1 Tax=Wenjunlia tyrosinilytica TaxID=1544741 RepID=A0A918DXL9_9ACTN|nr:alginate lyase family protein [Wenjunlia tyrosinilytica]GGO89429.1 hypothetical protein GCM10012280_32550 [Wenjunlia tyrosinilytica]
MPGARVSKGLAAATATVAVVVPLLVAGGPASSSAAGAQSAARVRHAAPAFKHPGVLVSGRQLNFVRGRVNKGAQPWKNAYRAMRESRYASLAYHPAPSAVVHCPFGEAPGHGCVEERQDALAAYTDALVWSISRDRAYARKAVSIMDAWSDVLKNHTSDNASLQAAWAGSTWARAAEIMRYTYKGWSPSHVRRFSTMLRRGYLPVVRKGNPKYNGNWELAMTDATMGIAVFLNDRSAFNKAVSTFRARVPAYFYLKKDGSRPKTRKGSGVTTRDQMTTYWFGQRTFANGLAQETCRNFTHVGYSLAATSHIAETAWHQGVDLYSGVKERLRQALGFHAHYELGAPAPQWLCGGKPELGLGPDTEVLYHHLHKRLGLTLPDAKRLTMRQRPAGTDNLFVAWETLTHAGNRY